MRCRRRASWIRSFDQDHSTFGVSTKVFNSARDVCVGVSERNDSERRHRIGGGVEQVEKLGVKVGIECFTRGDALFDGS